MSLVGRTDKELIKDIQNQEDSLVFGEFGSAIALKIGLDLAARAQKAQLPIAIDVTLSGQCLFHTAMPGATPDNAQWILRKNRVVERFHHSSLYMGALCRDAGTTLEQKYMLPPNTFAAFGGAFPIVLKSVGVVGTITVSGLPQVQDHDLVVQSIAAYLNSASEHS
ncbi:heme-degrading domain-containing protein [Cognatishimia sp. WU-CL00825]|uniref:heme-degrading domain-containing protein n=1 Tax=Cognatishimia sp. WU-CL00825 TaxID=3127658 RepID=UPI00310656AC